MVFISCSALLITLDVPGTEYRVATIAGPPEACQRAKKMVEDIVAEVCFSHLEVTSYLSM